MNPFSIKKINGGPTLLKDGEIFPPILYWSSDVNEIDFPAVREKGITLFTCFRSGPYYEFPYWTGEGKYDFSYYDKHLNMFHELVPDGYIIPRIFVAAPYWWLDKHPDEAVAFPDDLPREKGISGTYHESFASELWKQEMGKAFRELMRHFKNAPYGKQIVGIHIASGTCGEWHYWGGSRYPDCSPAMTKRYGKPIPPPEERDPDYFRCFFTAAVDAMGYFADIVREETDYLTLAFYTYLSGNYSVYSSHCATDEFLNLNKFDIVTSPHCYNRREGGMDGYFRVYPASMADHGILFLDESDDRTPLGTLRNMGPYRVIANTPEEAVGMMRREFGNAATHCIGQWFMDIDGGIFRDKLYMDTLGEMVKHCRRLSVPDRHRVSEVAVITDPGSNYYYNRKEYPAAVWAERECPGQLMKSGAPFDTFSAGDVSYEKLKQYKVIVTLEATALAPEVRSELKKLQSENRTIIWLGTPGIIDRENKMSKVEALRDLTGLDFREIPEMEILKLLPETGSWNEVVHQTPGFAVECADRSFADWRSIWGITFMAADFQKFFRESGVHIYIDSGDVFSVCSNALMIHAASEGNKTVTLPEPMTVVNLDDDAIIGENITNFTLPMKFAETALFELCK